LNPRNLKHFPKSIQTRSDSLGGGGLIAPCSPGRLFGAPQESKSKVQEEKRGDDRKVDGSKMLPGASRTKFAKVSLCDKKKSSLVYPKTSPREPKMANNDPRSTPKRSQGVPKRLKKACPSCKTKTKTYPRQSQDRPGSGGA